MTIKPSPNSNAGFTLVEIAIVLIIIGLLVGGVTTGAYLIKAASTRAVISEIGEFKTALALFNEKYAEWPGDVSNATALWSTAATRDGNGDGMIDATEGYAAWQHMALAEMIPGSYDGITARPKSRMETGQYSIEYANGAMVAGASWSYGLKGNVIILNKSGSTATPSIPADVTRAMPGVATTEAASIDKQLDDGSPIKGKIRVVNSIGSTCVVGTAPNIMYNIENGSDIPACTLIFAFGD